MSLPTTNPPPPPNSNQMTTNWLLMKKEERDLVNRTIFFGNLSIFVKEADFYDLCVPFGFIEAINVKMTGDRKAISYGFVKFLHRENAIQALEALNGTLFIGKPLRMGWAREFDVKGVRFTETTPSSFSSSPSAPSVSSPHPTAQMHISFHGTSLAVISEAYLRNLFEAFGPVIDITLKKHHFQQGNVQRGYGFIHFSLDQVGVNSAMDAVGEVNNRIVNGVFYKCELTHGLLALVHGRQQQQQPQPAQQLQSRLLPPPLPHPVPPLPSHPRPLPLSPEGSSSRFPRQEIIPSCSSLVDYPLQQFYPQHQSSSSSSSPPNSNISSSSSSLHHQRDQEQHNRW